MKYVTQAAGAEAVLSAHETLLFLGVLLGVLAITLSAIALGLALAKQGTLHPVSGRETRVDSGG